MSVCVITGRRVFHVTNAHRDDEVTTYRRVNGANVGFQRYRLMTAHYRFWCSVWQAAALISISALATEFVGNFL